MNGDKLLSNKNEEFGPGRDNFIESNKDMKTRSKKIMAVPMSMNGIINVIGKSENEVDPPVVRKI